GFKGFLKELSAAEGPGANPNIFSKSVGQPAALDLQSARRRNSFRMAPASRPGFLNRARCKSPGVTLILPFQISAAPWLKLNNQKPCDDCEASSAHPCAGIKSNRCLSPAFKWDDARPLHRKGQP